MTTQTATRNETPPSDSESLNRPNRSRWYLTALALVLAVALGALGCVLLAGGDDEADAIRADGGELTARQQEMVQTVKDFEAGAQATDGDEMASHMTADGYVEYIDEGWMFSVSDGSLQEWFSQDRYGSLRLAGPMMVYDDRVVLFGTVDDAGVSWVSIVHLTTTGDVQIVHESIEFWPNADR